ncbi:hypothetical protein HKCCE2091_03305 [Rhodobacterales bacterium HKCCE2091]|nr:hypothetical protein [Rhodobacterales bacterium HKCCE2091]
MGQTAALKIIAKAAGRDRVEPGEYVDVTPDYTVCQELSWATRKAILQKAGLDTLARPDRTVMVVDHTTSAGMGTAYYQAHREMKDFAAEQGAHFHGAGAGLRHQVMIENGYARPGALILSDEPNIASVGAVGALNFSVSTEVVVTQVFRSNWISVPRQVRMRLDGAFQPGVMARDLAQTIIRDFAETDTLTQSCIEYSGPGVASMSVDERQSLLACSYHSGADTAIMPVDAVALDWMKGRLPEDEIAPLHTDPAAVFDFETAYDLAGIEPMVTVPPELHLARPVAEVAGKRVDQAAIGSCANSRLSDLHAAARLLRGRRIAPHVVFYVTPGSREIYARAADDGTLAALTEAGAVILAPGCTTCWGYEGYLNPGEVQISTHQMNYRGRNGSRESLSYLASPMTVTASAIAGEIADPRAYLD